LEIFFALLARNYYNEKLGPNVYWLEMRES
jgi:hypothetical protein